MAHPRKILTVILLSAGCGTTPAPTAQTTAAEVPVPTLAPSAAPAPAVAAPRTPPTPLPDQAQPEALLTLRGELYGTNGTLASTAPRFRALCDADGYPLVGNVANKGPMRTVAEYCAEVRAATPARADA